MLSEYLAAGSSMDRRARVVEDEVYADGSKMAGGVHLYGTKSAGASGALMPSRGDACTASCSARGWMHFGDEAGGDAAVLSMQIGLNPIRVCRRPAGTSRCRCGERDPRSMWKAVHAARSDRSIRTSCRSHR